MLDHPITQKVIATVAAASIISIGGIGWQTSHRVTSLEHATNDVSESLKEIKTDVRATLEDTGEIRTDVAVLKERTKVLPAIIPNEQSRP